MRFIHFCLVCHKSVSIGSLVIKILQRLFVHLCCIIIFDTAFKENVSFSVSGMSFNALQLRSATVSLMKREYIEVKIVK